MRIKKLNFRIFVAVALAISFALILINHLQAQTIPSQYSLKLDVATSNSNATSRDILVPFTIDSSLLSASNLVLPGHTDILFATDLDVVTKGMVQDITNSTSTWWVVSDIPANSSSTERVYMSGPVAEHVFPVHANNFTFMEVSSTSTLEIADDLSLSVTVESTTCGVIVSKTNLLTEEDADGFGVFFVGNEDFVVSTSSTAPTSLDMEVYYDITPLQNFWLCGVSVGAPAFPGEYTRVRVQDIGTATVVLDTIPVYSPNADGTGVDTSLILRDTVLLTTGNTYRVFIDSALAQPVQTFFGGGFPGHMSSTGTVASFGQPEVSVTFDGAGYRPMLWAEDDTFTIPFIALPGVFWLAEDITSSTSTTADVTNSGRLESVINCHSLKSLGAVTTWDGSELNIELDYSSSNGDMVTTFNGFPFTFSLPTCQTFGNKSGSIDAGGTPLTDFELVSPITVDTVNATLFTAPVSGDLEKINVKIWWDRNGDGRTNITMDSTIRVALFDSSRNLIASPAAQVISLPSLPVDSIQQYTFSYILGIPVVAATDYYLAVWAGDVIQGSPVINRDIGNEELQVSFIDEIQNVANAVVLCPVDTIEDMPSTADRNAIYESITVYIDSIISGSPSITAAIYNFNLGTSEWDFVVSTDEVSASTGFNTMDFATPAKYDFDNFTTAIAVFSDEPIGTLQAGYGINIDPFEAGPDDNFPPVRTEGMKSCYDVNASASVYPTFPTGVPIGSRTTLHTPLFPDSEHQVFMYLTVSDYIEVELFPLNMSDAAFDIVQDDEDYDGLWPDPFTIDTTRSGKEITIWGDVIPSSFDLIGTSSDSLIIGGGLTGFVDDISITSSSTPVLLSPFNPTNTSQTQAGDAGNGFEYIGIIQDGSGSDNDLTYHIFADTVGISSLLIPLGASAVPLVLPSSQLPNIFGEPDVSALSTGSTVQQSFISDRLRGIAGSADFPATVFYLIITTAVLAVISGIATKKFDYNVIPWLIGISGYFLLSQFAGADFLIVFVILYALYSTGLTAILELVR